MEGVQRPEGRRCGCVEFGDGEAPCAGGGVVVVERDLEEATAERSIG